MGALFNPNSKLMIFLTRVADLLILNMLWLICCIPVVTAIPATAAMYYVTLKMVRQEDSGIVRSFFRSFWANLRQGVVLTILYLLFAVFLVVDYFACYMLPDAYETIPLVIIYVIGAIFLMVVAHTSPLLAQFSNTLGGVLRNAMILSLTKLSYSIRLVIISLVPVLILVLFPESFYTLFPLCMFLLPSVATWVCARFLNLLYAPMIASIKPEEPTSTEDEETAPAEEEETETPV